ncbi:MAG: hypothetical protein F6J86_09090 [Symploca sp. SIO1B1]|nr:hypothetical protein [Symploca sp. SIO1C2]NER93981.1 hypothetical protein [Symploca sp. SIO1B1]
MVTTSSVDAVLAINAPSVTLDDYATQALEAVESYYETTFYTETFSTVSITTVDGAKGVIISESLTGVVSQVTENLNDTSLDYVVQLLLSSTTIYAGMIYLAYQEGSIDEDSMYNAVLRYVQENPLTRFYGQMFGLVCLDKHISSIDLGDNKWQILDDLIEDSGLPIISGEVEPAVEEILDTINERGLLYYYLDEFIGRQTDIDSSKFTDSIKEKMLDRLVELEVTIDEDSYNEGDYDKYFILAYNYAQTGASDSEDPIDLVYSSKDFENTWDFSVDRFESIENERISKNNILAAGALDYIYCVGEVMQVFDIANALVLRWASGLLDIPDGDTASALYRFHKRRSERSTPEERAMLYKRVLNKGNGQVLSRMAVNSDFTTLWEQLISEVMRYIHKTERKAYWNTWQESGVRNTRIYEVTEDLQYNLSDYMTGMAHLQVTEDYNHLQEAMEIVNSDDVRSYYGGKRESLWNTIERIAKEEFGKAPNTETIKTLAVDGNKIFEWIANFNENAVKSSQFDQLLTSVEAWVLARETLNGKHYNHSPRSLPSRHPSNSPRMGNGGANFVAYDIKQGNMDDDDFEFDNLASTGVGSNEEFDRW